MKHNLFLTICASAIGALFHNTVLADDLALHRVTIDGSRSSLLGLLDAANAGIIDQKKLESMSVYRPGELLEAIPGVIVSQHSGEGKANQFYLRGFNLDHGTDLRTTIDDMPVNQRSHAHGQGWTDLNFLIPELTARLDYKKGPYSATTGDFSAAGTAAISYANRLTHGIGSVTLGENSYRRAILADSPEFGNGSLLYAVEALQNDGPFIQPTNYQKRNGVLRYSEGYANNGFNITAMAYQATWNSSDQIPLRAVQSGLLQNRFDTIDPSDGGAAQRYSLSGMWRRTTSDDASKVSAYVIRNQLDLFSNFTYFMDDPIHGDQFSQPDKRVTSGVNASHTWHLHNDKLAYDITVGTQLQNDNIFNGLNKTQERATLSQVRKDHITESSAAAYLDVSARWTDYFRSSFGVRADQYRYCVKSDRLENSGETQSSIVSPTLSLVFGPWQKSEWYFNIGQGFHSNDARASLTSLDPQSLEPTQKSPALVKANGLEFGFRTEYIPKLQSSISAFRLDFDSELRFVGDAGTTEPGRPSRRIGVEITNAYRANDWLWIDADLAFTHAYSRDFNPDGNHIEGAVEGVAQFALTLEKLGPWSANLRWRYFGPRPLTEDNSIRSRATSTLNGRISYKWRPDLRIELEGFNLSNRKDSAIDYYYASQLKGEKQPQADIHFHPTEARTFRVMVVKSF